jgi:quercetin dioxygenase-like cupin family protein
MIPDCRRSRDRCGRLPSVRGIESDDALPSCVDSGDSVRGITACKASERKMKAIVRTAAHSRTVAVVGDVYRFLATGEETGGKYALWEAIVPPGGGPPPHVHSREEEGFYVLEGEIAFRIGEERMVAAAGTFANMPVGTPHSFRNESGQTASMLISVAPAGLEQMFFEVGVSLAEGAATALPPSKDEIEKLLAVAPRYGVEIMLPPTH